MIAAIGSAAGSTPVPSIRELIFPPSIVAVPMRRMSPCLPPIISERSALSVPSEAKTPPAPSAIEDIAVQSESDAFVLIAALSTSKAYAPSASTLTKLNAYVPSTRRMPQPQENRFIFCIARFANCASNAATLAKSPALSAESSAEKQISPFSIFTEIGDCCEPTSRIGLSPCKELNCRVNPARSTTAVLSIRRDFVKKISALSTILSALVSPITASSCSSSAIALCTAQRVSSTMSDLPIVKR